MTSLVSIDPGYARAGAGCACAEFCESQLTRVWFARPYSWPSYAVATTVVWELPEVRPREDVSPGKANTLIRLAAEGAALAAAYVMPGGQVHAVTPAKWKGSITKPVHHGRILACLSEAEANVLWGVDEIKRRVTEAKIRGAKDRWVKPGGSYYGAWTGHNILDAVGIGLWYLKRE